MRTKHEAMSFSGDRRNQRVSAAVVAVDISTGGEGRDRSVSMNGAKVERSFCLERRFQQSAGERDYGKTYKAPRATRQHYSDYIEFERVE